MNVTDLTHDQFKDYLVALRDSSQLVQQHVWTLDRYEKNDDDLTDMVVGGEVQLDVTADVTRSCTLTLADPARMVRWGPDLHPQRISVWPGRMIQVTRGVWVDSVGEFVNVPIFTGPITSATRDGAQIDLELQGKETFMLAPYLSWVPNTWPKGTPYVKVIKDILTERGERKMALPDTGAALTKKFTYGRYAEAWKVVRFLAKRVNRVVYYDGAGIFNMHQPEPRTRHVFQTGVDVLTEPSYTWDLLAVANTVVVQYRVGDKDVTHVANINTHNMLSPIRVARLPSAPMRLVQIIADDTIKTEAAARELAQDLLNRWQQEPVSASFEALMVPHLHEYSRLQLVDEGLGTFVFRMLNATFGLGPEGTLAVNMNIDQMRRVKRKRQKHSHRSVHDAGGVGGR